MFNRKLSYVNNNVKIIILKYIINIIVKGLILFLANSVNRKYIEYENEVVEFTILSWKYKKGCDVKISLIYFM